MNGDVLNTPIEYLKGVGPKRAQLLQKELGIFVIEDLIHHYPFRHVDRSQVLKIKDLRPDMGNIQLFGKLQNIRKVGGKRMIRITAEFSDETGSIELVWFKGLRWLLSSLKEGQTYLLYGKPNLFKSHLNIAHPELEERSDPSKIMGPPLHPVYSTTEKLNQNGLTTRALAKLAYKALELTRKQIPETLSSSVIETHKLLSREAALQQLHFPSSQENLARAHFRIKFEELFFVQLRLLIQKLINQQKLKGFVFDVVGKHFNDFYEKALPFELTNAQKRVIKEIRSDLNKGVQMNRLLQGDVGSGKTMVAVMSMLIALDNGFQACLMAPTEILANQHMAGIQKLLKPIGIRVALLTGSTKDAERKALLEELQNGNIDIIIGTHALLEDRVVFKNLGLVVIDEQHRFGVAQRAKLWKKNNIPPHILVMTATPIPRTLAMTVYGDLDVSVIDELPPGRKAIKTIQRTDKARMQVFGFIESEIKKGRQIYIVYPLIEESKKMDYKDLMDGYESISRRFPKPEYQISIIHGQMKAQDKDWEMERFLKKETQIMVATTVIEVGVDVPNASVMVIESAERFGLSQLHQLRGRVGRGAEQSYCILMSGHKLSDDGRTRLQTMVESSDGFEIAEVDLRLRGPGDFHGTQQSGLPMELKLTNLTQDGHILSIARNAAQDLLKVDSNLSLPENASILKHYKKQQGRRANWSRIS